VTPFATLPAQSFAALDADAGLFWLACMSMVLLIGALVVAVTMAGRLRQIEEKLHRLERLDTLDAGLAQIVERHGELDLRRLEHVLLDMRDGQKRVEERLLAVVEAANQKHQSFTAIEKEGARGAVSDRIVNRLLALGFERIELLTQSEDLEALLKTGGDVLVEARREGALHKGRVILKDGAIADVQMRSSYEVFP
jgi:hypothetical protein